jgi:thiol-disulfide isomerase/thioredoxin
MHKLLIVVVGLLALAAGYYFSTLQFGQKSQAALPVAAQLSGISSSAHSVSLIGERRPDFKVGSQTGEWITSDDFPGKVLLINFWATWCGPCREEMPMLVDLQSQYGDQGLQVVGIALDDVQKVREFVQAFGITYPILVGSADVMVLNRDYGNQSGALPYSVLVDRDGIIRWQYSGALQSDELLNELQDWL